MLLPDAGRAVRSRSKSENSSGSASKPLAAGGQMHSAPGLSPDPSSEVRHTQPSPVDSLPSPVKLTPPHPTPSSPYLQCHWCWAWQGTPPRGLRRLGLGPRGQKQVVHQQGPHLCEDSEAGAPPRPPPRNPQHLFSPPPDSPSELPHGSDVGPSPAAGAWVAPQGSTGGPVGAAGLQGSPEAGVGAGPPQGSVAGTAGAQGSVDGAVPGAGAPHGSAAGAGAGAGAGKTSARSMSDCGEGVAVRGARGPHPPPCPLPTSSWPPGPVSLLLSSMAICSLRSSPRRIRSSCGHRGQCRPGHPDHSPAPSPGRTDGVDDEWGDTRGGGSPAVDGVWVGRGASLTLSCSSRLKLRASWSWTSSSGPQDGGWGERV